MDSSVSPKDEICFPRVCHHISNAVYFFNPKDGRNVCLQPQPALAAHITLQFTLGTATTPQTVGPGLETRQDQKIFLSSETSRPHPMVYRLWRSSGILRPMWKSLSRRAGQRWWLNQKGAPWSSRLAVGRETDLTP